ncbi:MAG: transposase [Sulfobacillus sp.]|nr:transposase [Sulfobacillus sp.]
MSSKLYRDYNMNQLWFPMDLEAWIPPNHVARVVHAAVERLDAAIFDAVYPGGGRPPYDPKMMTKILVYAYTQRIYSSRQIAKAVREQIPFLWLSAMQTPDFRTINRFRGERMKALLDDVCVQILRQLIEDGYIALEHYFLDGTKIEANANRYTAVWKKSVEGYKTSVEALIRELLKQIDPIVAEENAQYGDRDLEDVDPQPIRTAESPRDDATSSTDARLRAQPGAPAQSPPAADTPGKMVDAGRTSPDDAAGPNDPPSVTASPAESTPVSFREAVQNHLAQLEAKVQGLGPAARRQGARLLRKLRQDALPRWEKYTAQLATLGDRNRYSKTDPDATFMRMQDTPQGQAAPKPAYNVQVGTENQFIVGFSIHQRPGDTACLIPHLERLRTGLGR